jgi:hypothetical protein
VGERRTVWALNGSAFRPNGREELLLKALADEKDAYLAASQPLFLD